MVRVQGPSGAGEEKKPDLVGLESCVIDFSLCLYLKWGWGWHNHTFNKDLSGFNLEVKLEDHCFGVGE